MSDDRMELVLAGIQRQLDEMKEAQEKILAKLETVVSHEVRLNRAEADIADLKTSKREIWVSLNGHNERLKTVEDRCEHRKKHVEIVERLEKESPQAWWDSKVARWAERAGWAILVLLGPKILAWLGVKI